MKAQSEATSKELTNLRALVKERENTVQLAEKHANSNRWGYLVFGVLTGMMLMSLLLRMFP